MHKHENQLSEFILANVESLLSGWCEAIRSARIERETAHAQECRVATEELLTSIAHGLRLPEVLSHSGEQGSAWRQTRAEQLAQLHLTDGYPIEDLIRQLHALRASILRHWTEQIELVDRSNLQESARFTQEFDRAISTATAFYCRASEKGQTLFFGMLAHDLRSPLGAILVNAQLLKQGQPFDEAKIKRLADNIQHSVANASRIIADMLDLVRTGLGLGVTLIPSETNIQTLCEEVLEEIKLDHPKRIIQMEGRKELNARVDRMKIAQAFGNLIQHALQLSPSMTPVTVRADAEDGELVFSVHTQGEPIPPEEIDCLFDPMRRCALHAMTSSDPLADLGLGLFIAREIVLAHRGNISVRSDRELGTTFIIRLPLGA